MISVVIPLFNKADRVERTLRSVLAQTYKDFEVVVVDDGSTDGSADVVRSFGDARIRLLSQENAGVSAARNHGIREARGEWIALLDADDEWKPEYLATQVALSEKYPQCGVCATDYLFCDEHGLTTPTRINRLPFTGEDGVLSNYFEVASCSHPPICSISIMARKSAFEAVGGFPEGVRLGEDLITWARLACRYQIAYSRKTPAIYNFASQAARIVPQKKPNTYDYVGKAYKELTEKYDAPCLKNAAALWHKMRMVTYVQLQMRKEARQEFQILKGYVNPGKKYILWYVLSYMPMAVVRSFLRYKSRKTASTAITYSGRGDCITGGVKRLCYSKYANWPKTAYYYSFINGKAYKRVCAKAASGKEPLRVVFFVMNISMWKYESLFKLLLADKRFEPLIIFYPLMWNSVEQQKSAEKSVIDYCERMDFPYVRGFDIDNRKYLPANVLKADFVSWSQPYNNCPDFWKVEQFYRTALVFYYPYGLPIADKNAHFYNLLVQNVAWRIFEPSETLRPVYESNPITHGRNFRCVGNPTYDKLVDRQPSFADWKSNDQSLKRVIWAPHHTIGDNDDLPFSTFLEISNEMVELAKKYSSKVQFAFKPHPMLYNRLVEKWGKERTDHYYSQWNDMPNTSLVNGDYTDLFLTSDAMIHDCGGFTLEYLYTRKPVMFLTKPDHDKYLSDYSIKCHRQHYIGRGIEAIEHFIADVVIAGNDTMKEQREEFYRTELFPPNGVTAAQNMMNHFKSLLPCE